MIWEGRNLLLVVCIINWLTNHCILLTNIILLHMSYKNLPILLFILLLQFELTVHCYCFCFKWEITFLKTFYLFIYHYIYIITVFIYLYANKSFFISSCRFEFSSGIIFLKSAEFLLTFYCRTQMFMTNSLNFWNLKVSLFHFHFENWILLDIEF